MSIQGKKFPVLPASQVNLDEIFRLLTELNTQGHSIYSDPDQSNVFYLQLNDDYRIRISISKGQSQVQLHYLENSQGHLNASSIKDVERAIATFVRRVPGMTWPYQPKEARISANTPATNYSTISKLIGVSQLEAVFDPYLDNQGLEEIRNILSFGKGSVKDGIRLLGSKTTTSSQIPRFTKAGVDAWLSQLGIFGEARLVPSKSEHRRFMLLSGGKSLILGPSLNSIHKNEAIRVESGDQDKIFFDSVWKSADPLK